MIHTVDLPLDELVHPEPGDLMIGPRVTHQVLEARPVESVLWHNRWRLEVRSLGPTSPAHYAELAEGCRTWPVRPYRRGERPADRFAEIEGLAGRTLPPEGAVPGYDGGSGDGGPARAAGAPPDHEEEA